MQLPNPRHRRYVCTFLFQNNAVLLGRKQRGVGAGLLVGFGGEIEHGETAEEAARREFREETGGAEIVDPTECGILDCSFESESRTLTVHVFRATRFSGVPQNTPEMRPGWYSIANPPFSAMWPGDRLWFHLLAAGTPFRARTGYDDTERRSVLFHNIRTGKFTAPG